MVPRWYRSDRRSLPCWPARRGAAATTADRRETVLIVVQLSGGNDGLNTVVPYGDDLYARSRPTLALPAGKLHKIDTQLGFHPRMGGFARLLREGRLAVVQGVGYPNPSGDHEESMRIWQAAQRPARPDSVWLDRACRRTSCESQFTASDRRAGNRHQSATGPQLGDDPDSAPDDN